MNINIGTRIILGFLVVVSLMAGLAVYQLFAMDQLRTSINGILESNLTATRLIGEATASQQGMRVQTERSIALHFMCQSRSKNGQCTGGIVPSGSGLACALARVLPHS